MKKYNQIKRRLANILYKGYSSKLDYIANLIPTEMCLFLRHSLWLELRKQTNEKIQTNRN